MLPWLLFWSPQFHYPLSGSVAQRLAPELKWFFESIPEKAGIASIEKEIFESDSYGYQIGVIMEALIDYADLHYGKDTNLGKPFQKLRKLNKRVKKIKNKNVYAYSDQAISLMQNLHELDPEIFNVTLQQLRYEASRPLVRKNK